MTEAGWTREKPTKNGWYWWRFDASTSATIVRIMVCGDGSLAEMSNNGHLLLAANFGGEWFGPLSPNDYQQGRVAVNVDALVDRFLAWPLPASVCSDLCATKQGSPHRSGTNLLSAVEAKAMIEHVLGIAQQAQEAKEVAL